MKNRVLAFLLAGVMVVTSMAPLSVHAAEEEQIVEETESLSTEEGEAVSPLKDAKIVFEPVTIEVGSDEFYEPTFAIASYSIYANGSEETIVTGNGSGFMFEEGYHYFLCEDGQELQVGENLVKLNLYDWDGNCLASGELNITVKESKYTSLEIVSVDAVQTDHMIGTELGGEEFVMDVAYWITAECVARGEGIEKSFSATYDGGEAKLYVQGPCIVGQKAKFTVEFRGLTATGEVEVKGVDVSCVESEEMNEALSTCKDVIITALYSEDGENALVEQNYISKETLDALKECVNADADIELTLNVKTIKAETEEEKISEGKILEKVSAEYGNAAKYQLLDVSAVLEAWGESIGEVHNLGNTITITLTLSDDMKIESGKYVVVRNHNGEIDLLDTVVNEDGTISFDTDRFSMYALAVIDENAKDEESEVVEDQEKEDQKEEDQEKEDQKVEDQEKEDQKTEVDSEKQTGGAAATGDSSSVVIWAMIMMIAAAAVVTVKKYNR